MVYKTRGTCSTQIHFDVKDGKLTDVSYTGGCNGNLKGISKLVEGMDIDEVIRRLDGVSGSRAFAAEPNPPPVRISWLRL